MSTSTQSLPPLEFWARVRAELLDRYPGLREDTPILPESHRGPVPPPSVVGSWAGRTWEASFHPPRRFAPELQVGFTTAVRLVDPARMNTEWIPWLYAGERPRVLSKNFFDFDRIIMRYRRREGDFKGTLTGDAALDKRWGIYPYLDDLGAVFRQAAVRDTLSSAAALSPNPRSSLPALAVYGTEATFTVPVLPVAGHAPKVAASLKGFAGILDQLEEQRGSPPASRKPIAMDLLRDEHGRPFPVPRFQCPACGASTHPRYQANLDTEVCEQCGKILYRWT
jgi:hypothetical protein